MIQQHFLQQQRLNYNHDRLSDRYYRLLHPRMSEFRTFGTSSLPGRNYDQYLETIHRNGSRRNSVAAHSRAGIGSSSEIYRLMGDGASETLPRNVSSVVQHSRSQSVPLVHAEKYEPVQIYEHPLYGPTPSYLRPVSKGDDIQKKSMIFFSDKDDSDDERDIDRRSNSPRIESNRETQAALSTDAKNDDNDSSERAPLGYISYKKWKAKYGDLIPVDPLLFNIYTKRRNGSINKYGQSLYGSPAFHTRSTLDDDDLLHTTTLSDIESITSELPYENSLSSHRRYNRLQKPLPPRSYPARPLEPIHTESESSDDELSPPDSPVPYLSRNKQNSSTLTPFIATSSSAPSVTITPARSAINTSPSPSLIATSPPTPLVITSSSAPIVTTRSAAPLTTSSSSTSITTTSPAIPLTTTSPSSTSIPISSSTTITTTSPLVTTSSTAPITSTSSSTSLNITSPAKPITPSTNRVTATSSTLNTSIDNTTGTSPATLSSTNASSIPPAPPLPPSLAVTSSTTRYAAPSHIPITSSSPRSLTTSSSSAPYQAPSSISVPPPSVPSLAGSATKAVTFAGISSTAALNNDVSSSSDSEDEEKQRRRRRRKRQAAGGSGVDIDSLLFRQLKT